MSEGMRNYETTGRLEMQRDLDAQRALDAEQERVRQNLLTIMDLQAQLRQVEGELANEKTAYKKLSEQWNKDNVDLSTFREVENDMKDE